MDFFIIRSFIYIYQNLTKNADEEQAGLFRKALINCSWLVSMSNGNRAQICPLSMFCIQSCHIQHILNYLALNAFLFHGLLLSYLRNQDRPARGAYHFVLFWFLNQSAV